MGCGASKGDGSGSSSSKHATPGAASLEAAGRAGIEALLAHLRGTQVPSAEELSALGDDAESAASQWLKAVHVCVDAVWDPLVSSVEQKIATHGSGSSVWDQLTTVEVLQFLLEATGGNPTSVCEATNALLAIAAALWRRQRQRSARGLPKSAAAEAAFPSGPLCRLLGLLGICLCRTVGVEDPTGLSRRLTPWNNLRTAFGLDSSAHLCALLDGRAKGLLIYCRMVSTHGDARLKLAVSREGALWDALPAWLDSPFADDDCEPRSCKLFPRFHGEAGEGHGPRKELFAIIGAQLLLGSDGGGGGSGGGSKSAAVLPYVTASRQHWLEPSLQKTREGERLCRFAGWLVGQSICNRAPLQSSAFPPLLFRCLLGTDDAGTDPTPTLELLEEFDPTAASNLKSIEKMKPADFEAMCELEDLDSSSTSREQYVRVACGRLLFGEEGTGVRWQLHALVEGFRQALPLSVLGEFDLTPSQLAHAVCGAADGGADAPFSITKTFRIAQVADDYIDCEPLCDALWRVLEAWPPREKRRFVKFVTGSDRLPPPGGEVISLQAPMVELRAGTSLLGMLPQAHTCDNLLELPNYWEALCAQKGVPITTRSDKSLVKELEKLLQQRLEMAVSCDGYALDETAEAGGGGGGAHHATALRDRTNTMSADISGIMMPGGRCGDRGETISPMYNNSSSSGNAAGNGSMSPRVQQQQIRAQAERAQAAQAAQAVEEEDMLDTLLIGTDIIHQSSMPRPPPPRRVQQQQQSRPPAALPPSERAVDISELGDDDLMNHIQEMPSHQADAVTAFKLDDDSDEGVDDLITQLGVQEGSASPRRAQPPPPRAIELTAQRTAGDVDSKLTQSDIDIDLELEIEALDL